MSAESNIHLMNPPGDHHKVYACRTMWKETYNYEPKHSTCSTSHPTAGHQDAKVVAKIKIQ